MEKENKWISVKDKLPELNSTSWNTFFCSNPVLTLHKDGHHEDCILNKPYELNKPPFWTYVQDAEYTENVTHWMPLPEPPESE